MKLQTATFAGGCFWCTEAIFKMIKGVKKVVSGYAADAEAIQITFDPKVVSYQNLLYIFFHTHDPTTSGRQENDVGSQYRSVVFYHDEEQKRQALRAKEEIPGAVTEVVPFKNFFPAESYHQDFYDKNPNQLYCQLVIDPKIEKLKKEFGKYLKES